MNWFVILGCAGGIICLIDYTCQMFAKIIAICRNYNKYKRAYEHSRVDKPAMGFKTEKEQQAEIEARLSRK